VGCKTSGGSPPPHELAEVSERLRVVTGKNWFERRELASRSLVAARFFGLQHSQKLFRNEWETRGVVVSTGQKFSVFRDEAGQEYDSPGRPPEGISLGDEVTFIASGDDSSGRRPWASDPAAA
jgi:hypothetical protein